MKIFAEKDNVNDEEVIILEINFGEGDAVKEGDHILDLETSKTVMEIESPQNGFLKLFVQEGEEIPIGECLFEILETQSELVINENDISTSEVIKPPKDDYIFSKEAKEKLDELGISDYTFDKKMVSVQDVLMLASEREDNNSTKRNIDNTNNQQVDSKSEENLPKFSNFIRKKHSLRKRAEIKNLSLNGNISTQSVIGTKVRTLPTRSYETPFLFKDSISDIATYEISKALLEYPELNSFYINDKEYGEYEEINAGFSFDNDSNLKVFSINSANNFTLQEIQIKIQEYLELYESNKTIDEKILSSATFTISDLSKSGSSFMIPLVSNYQSSIIGITKDSNYSYSLFVGFDHKVSSGLYVSKFLEHVKENIESHFINENTINFLRCDKCEMSAEEAKSLKNIGFIQMLNFEGNTINICVNCFNGY